MPNNATGLICPVCGVCSEEPLYPVSIRSARWMCRCQNDNGCFIWPSVVDGELEDYYETSYTSGEGWKRINRLSALAHWEKVKFRFPEKQAFRFLEVGGAYGFFSRLVKDKTMASLVKIVEPGRIAAEYARTELDLEVCCGDISRLSVDEYFDVIFAAHVIEHVSNPSEFLESCLNHLSPNGKLLILTPNAEAWKFDLLREFWTWAAPAEHITFLSVCSAKKMVTSLRCNVEIEKLIAKRFGYPLILPSLLQRYAPGLLRRRDDYSEVASTNSVSTSSIPSARSRILSWCKQIVLGMDYGFCRVMDNLSEEPDELLITLSRGKTECSTIDA